MPKGFIRSRQFMAGVLVTLAALTLLAVLGSALA